MWKKMYSLMNYSKLSLMFLWRQSKKYVLLIVLKILLDAVQVFPPMYLASWSINLLVCKVEFREYFQVILFIILLIIVLAILRNILSSRLNYTKKALYDKIKMDINNICLYTDYENVQSKTFMEKKNMAIESLNSGCLDMFIESLHRLVSGILIIAGVIYIISEVSLWILIPVAISLLIGFYYDYLNARQAFVDTKESVEFERKSSYLQKIACDFAYAKEIRLFGLKDRFKKRMDEVDELRYKLKEIRRKQRDIPVILYYLADTVLDVSLYLYLGYLVLVVQTITLGQFSIYYQALRKIKDSANDIISVLTEFAVNSEYLKAFFDFLLYKTVSQDLNDDSEILPYAEIRFEHVYYRYPNAEDFTLKDINITLNAGETLLVVGENGAGKSTFIKLLCGLYKPTIGTIYLNGRDISTIDKSLYVRQISAVFQDYRLFASSVEDNISAMRIVDENIISESLEKVSLTEVIDSAPKGSKTSLYRIFDEDGVEFSGGEMQRLAIARAIYKHSPILVLDEPTSALDPKAEYEIYKSFSSISKNRTAVYISHRLSSIKFSDKVAVFDNGKIVEYGTHDSLMQLNGLYSELYSLQADFYNNERSEAI